MKSKGKRFLFALRNKRFYLFFLFLLPILILSPGIMKFPYPSPEALYSDITTTHYPNTLYLKQAIINFHEIPLWSDMIMSGYPFAADPLSGLWYPPGWIALLFPLPLGFNLLTLIHLVIGGVGMYLYLKAIGIHDWGAIFGGLAFELMPKVFAHYGAGHLSLIYAITWTPWLFFASQALFHENKTIKKVVFPAIFLALIFLADPRWVVYAGGIWIVYMLAHRYNPGEILGGGRAREFSLLVSQVKSRLKVILSVGLLSFALSAPLALPLIEYTHYSTRTMMRANDVLIYSLPMERLLDLMFPDYGGFHEWVTYFGGILFVLVILALINCFDEFEVRFWSIVSGVLILYSLGSHLPFSDFISLMPGLDLLRVPPRGLFIVGFGFSILGSVAVDRLFFNFNNEDINTKRTRLYLVGLVSFVLIVSISITIMTKNLQPKFYWGTLMTILGTIIIFIALRDKRYHSYLFGFLLVISIVDWLVFDFSAIEFRSPGEIANENRKLAEELAQDNGYFRVYSPSYSLPQNLAAEYGFELVDGIDPLQLESYGKFMKQASGVPDNGYSVTIPPFAMGDPRNDNKNYKPNPVLLGLLNTKYVVSVYDLKVDGLIFQDNIDGIRLYRNEAYLPRAWVQSSLFNKEMKAPVEITKKTSNKIVLRAKGPGVVVISEIIYPGWKVFVNGKRAKLLSPYGLLRGVKIEEGEQIVEFIYKPLILAIGLIIFIIAILVILAGIVLNRKNV
ncbi:MAG TPA: YfhO family protein [Anaerolineae bacterium]|nr:YfhO family protein [Anaerolineae bacterium]